VAYASFLSPRPDEDAQEAVYVAELDGTRTEFLRGDKERFLSNPVWSPDGSQIAMTIMLRRLPGPQMGTQVVVLDYASKKATVLAEAWPIEEDAVPWKCFTMPSWSPDGRWVAVRLGLAQPVIFSSDGTTTKYVIFDDESALYSVAYANAAVKTLEMQKRFSEARKSASKVLKLVDDCLARLKPGPPMEEDLKTQRLYPLFILNKFQDVLAAGKGSKERMAGGLVEKAHLALGQYDQVKDADKVVKQAQELEKKAAESKEPSGSARLWLQAGDIWYEKLLSQKMSLQAYENAAKALPGSPEAKTAQEKIAEVKARFAVEEGR
jgi:hypothetical protein